MPGDVDKEQAIPFRTSPGCGCCGCTTDVPLSVVNCHGDFPPGASATMVSCARQTLTMRGDPTGGTFLLGFGGETTTPIPWDAAAGRVAHDLAALSTVGTDNVTASGGPFPLAPIVVTFTGALAGLDLELIEADNTGLTGGDGPAVEIGSTVTGGEELGPIDFDDETGRAVFEGVPPALYQLTVTAVDYLDVTSLLEIACVPRPDVTFPLTVADGKIVLPGSPAPFAPPGSVSMSSVPLPPSGGLMLASCTGGTATYFAASDVQDGELPCLPNPPCSECDGPKPYQRQAFFVASFGCANGFAVVWKFTMPGISPICGPPEPCLPGNDPGNLSCTFCGCTDFWLEIGHDDLSRFAACGREVRLHISPGIIAIGGGGCFTASTTLNVTGDESAELTTTGWNGIAIDSQLSMLWGVQQPPFPCAAPIVLESVPCPTVTL